LQNFFGRASVDARESVAMSRSQALMLDLALVALATFISLLLRDNFETSVDHLQALFPYLLATLGVSVATFPVFGASRGLWRYTSFDDGLNIASATIAAVIGAMAVCFSFNRLDGVPRSLPIIQGLLVVALLMGARLAARLRNDLLERERAFGAVSPEGEGAVQTVLLVGLGRVTDLYLRCVEEFGAASIRVAGILGDDRRQTGYSAYGAPILGLPDELARALGTLEVHGVFVDSVLVTVRPELLSPEARAALHSVEAEGRARVDYLYERMGLAPEPPVSPGPGSRETGDAFRLGDASALRKDAERPVWRAKRGIDIVMSATLLALCAPLMALLSLGVAADIGFPVTFWQQRPGLGGRAFKLRKFRTMRAAHDANGNRLDDSARQSAFGAFLRRSRLDELPQLVNVLRGEMSFIGPRPLLPCDQAPGGEARLLVRPGLTGWAQVKGGREISAADKTALDLWYLRNASLALDVAILFDTLRMVLFGDRIDRAAVALAWREAKGGAPNGAPRASQFFRRLSRQARAAARRRLSNWSKRAVGLPGIVKRAP